MNLGRLNLSELRYFRALAYELHFSRAAQQLGIAQPSLSLKIRRLEAALGVRLFARGTRRVGLTAAGRVLLDRAEKILADIEQAGEAVHLAERGEIGHINIGFVSLAALDVLPPLVRRVRERYPQVTIGLFERSSEEQALMVRDGRLDVGIVREPRALAGLASRHIVDDPQIVALPRSHRLSHRPRIALKDLKDDAFILFPRREGAAMFDRIIEACGRAGFSPNVVQEATMIATMVGLVAARIGVAIVPSVTRLIAETGVIYRPLVPKLTVDTGLIWAPPMAKLNPVLGALVRPDLRVRAD